jgi:flagellar basal body-associated protein FliL
MAPDSKPAADENKDDGGKKKRNLKPLIIVGVLMLVEGVGVFALVKLISPAPVSVEAAEGEDADPDPLQLDGQVEVVMCDISAFNRKEGKMRVYQMQVSALVPADDLEQVERFVEVRKMSINDRVQTVIRSADPRHLNDPALDVIKRQIKFELNNLLGGKELIQDVLISKLLQSRSNL